MAHSKASNKNANSISVVVPAFNEEENLAATIETIRRSFEGNFSTYEIIVVNDGSRDNTGKVAETIAKTDKRVKVIHNDRNSGYGYSVLRGGSEAQHEYFMLIPGDNEIPTESINAIASRIGEADMIIPYMKNFRVRPFGRRLISWVFTALLNTLFFMRLNYYNGPSAIRARLLNSAEAHTTGFAWQAAILVQLIKRKYTYRQVGINLAPRRFGKSTMVSFKNILNVINTIAWLYWNVNITRRLRNV